MSDFFICNQEAINTKLKSLQKTNVSEDGWTSYYINEHATEEWELTTYESEYHGGGIPILKKQPNLPISQLIEIALTSKDMNDITGAAIELSEREKYNDEIFRTELLERLQLIDIVELSDFEKERLKTIIYDSHLYDPTNKKEIVGKHWTEIKKDAEFYSSISEKAKQILNNLK